MKKNKTLFILMLLITPNLCFAAINKTFLLQQNSHAKVQKGQKANYAQKQIPKGTASAKVTKAQRSKPALHARKGQKMLVPLKLNNTRQRSHRVVASAKPVRTQETKPILHTRKEHKTLTALKVRNIKKPVSNTIGKSKSIVKHDKQIALPVQQSKSRVGRLIKENIPYSTLEQATIDYKEAIKLLQHGNANEASIHLQKVLDKAPMHTEARTKLIGYYRGRGDMLKVEELLQQGLHINDQEPIYIKQMAALLNENGKHGEALSLLLKMPASKQEDLEYKALLALTYFHEGLFDLSQKNYVQLLRIEPRNSKWRLGLAVSQDAIGDYQRALDNFSKARTYGGLDSNTIKYIQKRMDVLLEYFTTATRSVYYGAT